MSQTVERQHSPTRKNIFTRLRSKSNASNALRRVESNDSSASAGTNGTVSSSGTNSSHNTQRTTGKNRFKKIIENDKSEGFSILDQLINAGQMRLNQNQSHSHTDGDKVEGNTAHQNSIKDIAFEVKASPRNVHPLDQPLVSSKGRIIISPNKSKFPLKATTSSSSDSTEDRTIVQILTDVINVSILFATYCFHLVKKFWNLDLFVDIVGSENNTIKVHIPSVVIVILGLYTLSTLGSSSSSASQGYFKEYNGGKSRTILGSLFNIAIIIGLLSLLVIKLMSPPKESDETKITEAEVKKITNLAIGEAVQEPKETNTQIPLENFPSPRIRRTEVTPELILNTAKVPTIEKQNAYFTDDEDDNEEENQYYLLTANHNKPAPKSKRLRRVRHNSNVEYIDDMDYNYQHNTNIKTSYGSSVGYGDFVSRAMNINYQ